MIKNINDLSISQYYEFEELLKNNDIDTISECETFEEVDKIILNKIVELLNNARNKIKKNVDSVMTYTYYEVGRRIVEEEQKGKERAEYGRQLLVNLSKILIKEFFLKLKKNQYYPQDTFHS